MYTIGENLQYYSDVFLMYRRTKNFYFIYNKFKQYVKSLSKMYEIDEGELWEKIYKKRDYIGNEKAFFTLMSYFLKDVLVKKNRKNKKNINFIDLENIEGKKTDYLEELIKKEKMEVAEQIIKQYENWEIILDFLNNYTHEEICKRHNKTARQLTNIKYRFFKKILSKKQKKV